MHPGSVNLKSESPAHPTNKSDPDRRGATRYYFAAIAAIIDLDKPGELVLSYSRPEHLRLFCEDDDSVPHGNAGTDTDYPFWRRVRGYRSRHRKRHTNGYGHRLYRDRVKMIERSSKDG